MAAATEDRLDVFVNQQNFGLITQPEIANPQSDTFYESTLAELDSNGLVTPLTHTSGEDDSGVLTGAVLDHYSAETREAFTGNVQYDRAGQTPRIKLRHGVIVEFEIADSIGNYSLRQDVYGVDNQTVNAAQGDGSGGNYPFVGRVYDILSDSVKVYVPGILG